MDYDELVAKVIELLQREKRVPYRTLKRRFDVDDGYIEDLKIDLIEAKRLAIDENDRILVWVGDVQEVAAQPTQPTQPPAAQAQHSPQLAPLPTVPSPPDAERRQLTVVFCDLVDSTKLSSQLDPEDYREVVRAYQSACTEVIQRFDGNVAQLLGDGVLVYFGYPHAHEDDPHRAVRTGLGILAAMGELNSRLQQEKGIQLALRIGIHTGLVVVGQMGGGERQEQLALGEVPNVCSRIEGLAAPNTIAVSEATYRLIRGYFECQDLGAQALRGITESMHIYQVLNESDATSRLDVAQVRGLIPLVGRESEVTLLLERWQQAKAGHGQVILLSGEAGIGKSRLVQVLKEHVINEPHTRWECRSAEYSQNTALFPLVDLFQRMLRFHAEDTSDEKLGKLEQALSQFRLPIEESIQLFAPLLSLPIPEDRYPPLNLSPQRQRQKSLESIVAILLELAERQPVLFILEDLHWTDPSTLELISLLLDQTPTASLVVLLTCRPHFQPAWHHRSYLTEMTLNRLSHTQVEQIVNRIIDGKTLPQEVLQQILTKTDGVPLFVEEMTKAILESGQLKAVNEHYEFTGSLSTFTIPATLQDSLMARLDRLVTAKGVAQMGATIGRQFAYALLHAVSQLDAITLQRELGRLVEAEIVYQRGVPPLSTYVFKHALIQDAGYQSLLRSTRQRYHRRIAEVLVERFPETIEIQPELLAHHYTEAGLNEQAIAYWQQAGERAIVRSSNMEAIAHLTKGLELLKTLPETPARTEQDLMLHITLGRPLMATRGYAAPEVEDVFTRVRQLCHHVERTPQLLPVLFGLRRFYLHRGQLQTAHEFAEQALSLAQHVQDPLPLMEAHYAVGITLCYRGELAVARVHLETSLDLYASAQQRAGALRYRFDSPGVTGQGHIARVLWLLGYPDQALGRSREALTLAQELLHPTSEAFALVFIVIMHYLRREVQAVYERFDALIGLATAQGLPFIVAWGTLLWGWSLAIRGQAEEGITTIRQGLAMMHDTGEELDRLCGLAFLVETYGITGQAEEGLTVLAEALTLADKNDERWWEAELHRLKGELLLQQNSNNHVEAENCFHHAIRIAQSQQAKSWELRAATSLARLWQQQGKRQEAHDLLAPVYGWFTEGFDTADLQDAKVLLDELA
jgi:class 3 adenylate cyclase/predicted ATPase